MNSLNAIADSAPVDPAGTLQVEIEPDSSRFADQILVGHQTPAATIRAVVAIVANHEVVPGGDHAVGGNPLLEGGIVRVALTLRAGLIAQIATVGGFADPFAIAE